MPGTSTTYTIVVRNAGPSTAVDQAVTDIFPSAITAVSWTAVASPGSSVAAASGTGNINTTVTLLPGGTVTFTAVAQVSPAATGSLGQHRHGGRAPGRHHPGRQHRHRHRHPDAPGRPGRHQGRRQTTAVPGTSTTYTITVGNAGPSAATGAALSDPLPAGVTAATWAFAGASGGGSVTGPSSGTGALATTVNLPVGATVTFSFTVQVDPTATGTLVNTATVTPPGGTPTGATDIDTPDAPGRPVRHQDRRRHRAVPGTPTTYTIVVSNAGPSTVTSLTLTDAVPAALLGAGLRRAQRRQLRPGHGPVDRPEPGGRASRSPSP